MSRVARFAEAHEIFFRHLAAFGLGHDMAAMVCFPRTASDTASVGGHNVGADGGGDTGFGHGDSPAGLLAR